MAQKFRKPSRKGHRKISEQKLASLKKMPFAIVPARRSCAMSICARSSLI
jgi:hypothetical protein